jgi:hypothetical protein
MIEYKLAWKLTDDQAETVQRETMAIIEFLFCRLKSDTRLESDVSREIALIALLEALAIVIAGCTSGEDDDETFEKLLEALTYTLKRSVRQIRASDATGKLIARVQAKRKRNKPRNSTRDRD